ncbi:class C sortase [Propionimicrobium lymphophilum]|uniref:class C sortase n=1 Tax=Propionimicrobium lymphophilum TaxID=33012 RepID=UPI00288B8AB9|nr:class C sortase [Propionimicrobium lymphophilum]
MSVASSSLWEESPAEKKGKKARGKLIDGLLVLAFIVGLLVLLYPSIADYYNSFRQGRAIATYDAAVAKMTPQDFSNFWQAAEAYNRELINNPARLHMSPAQKTQYDSLLNVTGDLMMGHLEIKKLGVSLPVYHGVDDAVLQIGVGHIPGTSLPTGGEGTHVALSGHRGLPTSKLFTDLDQMVEGDRFVLHVLDRSMAYVVDQVRVVEPNEVQNLKIVDGEDYVTLVTCTPYSINTHRLLVRGHRTSYLDDGEYVAADAVKVDPILVSSVMSVPVFTILFVWALARTRRNRKRSAQPQGQ